ncbi:sulfatase family protein [Oleiharenicola lentus]|uniref:sulfatase family protein n=1 Tax=Oleiharenicola lentus TaxID=2508720 RepID=UPI003F678C23
MKNFLPALVGFIVATFPICAAETADERPNIIFILADDMGRGDVSAYNPNAAWKTPHLDQLAAEGVLFTDAHSSSAVCTPSRYSVMTGRYAWRSELKKGVANGFSPPVIEDDRLCVATLLKGKGYTTAMFGKWHLGLAWAKKADATNDQDVDYRQPFDGGPTARGFDHFFGISASLDMPPYVWLRDNRVVAAPNTTAPGNQGLTMWRAGPISEDFAHADVQPRLIRAATEFIARQNKQKPFFIYLALASPHTPILPTGKFAGQTQTTPYGDFCVQVDHDMGAIVSALKAAGLDENTLIIFTADNGCSPAANLADLAKFKHDPQVGSRGHKADLYEGGHRVPFIARWPAKIPAGARSDALVCQVDFMATCAELVAQLLPATAGEDSASFLPVLKNPAAHSQVRDSLVHHSINGSFAIRSGKWKLCLAPDLGGWSDPRPGKAPAGSPPFQLFDLEKDPAETTNLFAQHPEIVRALDAKLKQHVLAGRSTPGAPQPNTGGNDWLELAWMKEFSTPAR